MFLFFFLDFKVISFSFLDERNIFIQNSFQFRCYFHLHLITQHSECISFSSHWDLYAPNISNKSKDHNYLFISIDKIKSASVFIGDMSHYQNKSLDLMKPLAWAQCKCKQCPDRINVFETLFASKGAMRIWTHDNMIHHIRVNVKEMDIVWQSYARMKDQIGPKLIFITF